MSLFQTLFKKITESPILYVRFKKNEFEIKHIQSGKSISRKATTPFSNDRLLIADFETAEAFMKNIIDELLKDENKLILKSNRIIIQPVDSILNTITPNDKKLYIECGITSGAKDVWLTNKPGLLSDEAILELLKK